MEKAVNIGLRGMILQIAIWQVLQACDCSQEVSQPAPGMIIADVGKKASLQKLNCYQWAQWHPDPKAPYIVEKQAIRTVLIINFIDRMK